MSIDQVKSSCFRQSLQTDQMVGVIDSGVVMPVSLEKTKEEKLDMGTNVHIFSEAVGRSTKQNQYPVNKMSVQKMTQRDSSVEYVKSTTVFRGKIFCFSNLFPEERVSYQDLCYEYKYVYSTLLHWICELEYKVSMHMKYVLEKWESRKFLNVECSALRDVSGKMTYSAGELRIDLGFLKITSKGKIFITGYILTGSQTAKCHNHILARP